MWLARRNLRHEPVQVLLTILAIGLSVMLVVILLGVLSGVRRQAGDYLAAAPGSIVVASSGTENFLMVAVPLPAGTMDRVRTAPGVADAVPLLSQTVVLHLHERHEAAFVIGYDPGRGGGPRNLANGHAPERDQDIVLGRLLAQRHGVGVGDQVSLLGRTFTVTGLSDDPSPLMTSFVFISKTTLERLLLAPGATSVLLVTPMEGVSTDDLREALAGLPGVDALPKQRVIANDIRLFTGAFQPVVRLMAGLALTTGTLVVGLLVYTATLQKRREYGVLKAVGVRNRVLYRIIATQSLVVAVTGSVSGIILAGLVARLIMAIRPEFFIPITWSGTVLASGAGIVMALVAAVAPARVIARLAPADVVRG